MREPVYKYISVKSIYAQVKEELKSYFNTGAVDDLLFDTYTLYVISEFNRTYFKKYEMPLKVEDGEAKLPDNFRFVKGVFICSNVNVLSNIGGSRYFLDDCRLLSLPRNRCDVCFELPDPCANCSKCINKDYTVIHAHRQFEIMNYRISQELFPDYMTRENKCLHCSKGKNLGDRFYSISEDSCRLYVPFTSGTVHLEYYGDPYGQFGEDIQIPDRPAFKDYLLKYLKFKTFESLFNSTTDESFNQITQKLSFYKTEKEIAYVDAKNESITQTQEQVAKSIIRNRRNLSRNFRNY